MYLDREAFDTIDCGILLNWFQGLGVEGTVIWWFLSFFHSQFVSVGRRGEVKSTPLKCGVPQSSKFHHSF